ncbi:MAG: cellulose-binding protein, partial [Actinomycetales bacterium]|nr:cellulose-binding protein [Actinomycetales bacterium]
MVTRPPLRAILTTLLLALTALVAAPAGPAQAAPVKIMPLGDSITGSPGCWRALLWNQLQSAGYTNIDFVGTLPPQGCGVAHDGDNEGHGGILATNMAAQNQLPPWLSATNPDIVLMHLGTNDVWSARTPQQILDAFSTLLTQMRANNPNVKLIVAKIIPVAPSSCSDCPARTVAFNDAIPGWAAARSTAASPITVVDQWTGWVPATDTGDGVHPNDSGIQKMANRWYPAVVAALSGQTPTTTTTTTTRSTTTTTTRPTTTTTTTTTTRTTPPTTTTTTSQQQGGCTAAYSVQSQWPGGFVANVNVTAGSSAINGWRVTMTLPSG